MTSGLALGLRRPILLAALLFCLPRALVGQGETFGDSLSFETSFQDGIEASFLWTLYQLNTADVDGDVVIRVSSEDFDPLVAVVTPSQAMAVGVTPDSPAESSEVRITGQPGEWWIIVTSWRPLAEGIFTLEVDVTGAHEVEAADPYDLPPAYVELLFYRGDRRATAARGPTFEPFPWPVPRPSSRYEFDRSEVMIQPQDATLGRVADALSAAVQEAGYPDLGFLAAPNGFALVCAPEEIDADGTPRPPPGRWDDVTDLPDSLVGWFLGLFRGNPGRYRVIVFLVTDVPVEMEMAEVSRDEADLWIGNSLTNLPDEVSATPLSSQHRVHALVYEFLQSAPDTDPALVIGAVAHTHLERSGVLDALPR